MKSMPSSFKMATHNTSLVARCWCCVLLAALAVNAGWVMTWNDEFNGDQIDETRWNVYNNWSQLSNQVEIYIEKNAYVQNGNLMLKVTKEPYLFEGLLYNFTSGKVDSLHKFSQKFGRWEFKAKLPNVYASGVHPALWLLGESCWPVGGEIDVMEQTCNYKNVYTTSTLHFGKECGKDLSHVRPSEFPSPRSGVTVNFTSDYHVFSAEWNSSHISYFVDSNCTLVLPASTNVSIPQNDMFIIISAAVMRAQSFPQPDWVWPVFHIVDYVRVYTWE